MHKQVRLFLGIAFIEGASVMAVELSGAKLVAPFFGDSLAVWASVLGVTMMGLALGYFLGGRMSEKMKGPEKLFLVLAGAAFFTALMPLDSRWVMQATQSMDVRWGSLLSAMVFLMPPMLLFGMVSPLLIRLGSTEPEKAGKVSGMVFGLSTIGGIFATFLMGFYLIPNWGLTRPLWLFAGLLFMLPILFWGKQKKWKNTIAVIFLSLLGPGLELIFA